MFWKKKKIKKPSCNHFWHYLQHDYIYHDRGVDVDADDGAWIFCSNCESEKLIYVEQWQRIEKKQEILMGNKQNDPTAN
jgi:hypothetical protein